MYIIKKMEIRNIFNIERISENSHGGIGYLEKSRVLYKNHFKTKIDFVDFVIVKPNETIGKHKHALNEEIYFVIKGNGVMSINEHQYKVSTGDFVVNSFYDTHELVNNSNTNIELLIFQVSK